MQLRSAIHRFARGLGRTLAVLALSPLGYGTPAVAETPLVDHVIIVTMDGLRADAVTSIEAELIPNLLRMHAASATLEARASSEWTRTLPNHIAMMTARPPEGPLGHQWISNAFEEGDTIHANNGGAYVASIFDVAHDHGLFTALHAGKDKFELLSDSYDQANGADDLTGADDGRDKIDAWIFETNPHTTIADVVAELESKASERTLHFVHFRDPDTTGHASGWDLTPGSDYVGAVADLDQALGTLLDAIVADPALAADTAVLLTADHGGGIPSRHEIDNHWDEDARVNYTVPLLVWFCDGQEPVDLYAINGDTRTDPGTAQVPDPPAPFQPIRHADVGNAALALLGLPPVPDSAINAEQDLRVVDGPLTCGTSMCEPGACPSSEACPDMCYPQAEAPEHRCRSCGWPLPDTTCVVNVFYILRAVVGLEECSPCVCDVDGNETVAPTDVLARVRGCVGLEYSARCPTPGAASVRP